MRSARKPGRWLCWVDERPAPELACEVVQVRLSELSLPHPRQFGGCWLALRLWDQLDLEGFWAERLRPSRKGTRWLNGLKVLVCQRLLAPGVNGGCTGSGSGRRRWQTCWERTSPWPGRIPYTAAWIVC